MRAILTWHSIDRSGSPISVTPEQWRRQLDWLAAGPATVTTLAALAEGSIPGPAVALTFDDGFANFATEALPLLLEYGFPATLFVVSDHVGGDNRWRGRSSSVVPRLPLLGWEDLAALPTALISIGAHTRSHPHLERLADPAEVEDELRGCADEVEQRLGRRPVAVAYPYGGVSPAVAQAAGRHFRWGCTTELRPLRHTETPALLPRVDVHYLRAPHRLGPWGSARMRGWLGLRRGGRRLRALMEGRAAA